METLYSTIDLGVFRDFSGISNGFYIVIIFVVIFTVATILQRLLRKFLDRSAGILKIEKTHFNFLKHTITLVIYAFSIVLVFYIVPSLRSVGVALFAGAGVFAAVVGFASQQALSNVTSGFFLAIFRPFRVGDIMEIEASKDNYRGTVEDINLRHTVIRDFENKRIIIPNAVISAATLTNYSVHDPKIAKFIEMGISYDSDMNKAIQIMREVSENHPLNIDNRSPEDIDKGAPRVAVDVIGFGDSSVRLRASVWTNNPMDARQMSYDLYKQIKERFDKEGVEIPYPYRTIVYKKDMGSK